MNTNELRIGNWIRAEGQMAKVLGISPTGRIKVSGERKGWIYASDCHPIRLNYEVLEKFGFERGGKNWYQHKDKVVIRHSINEEHEYYLEEGLHTRGIGYLHQLQNWLFMLRGEEINMELLSLQKQ